MGMKRITQKKIYRITSSLISKIIVLTYVMSAILVNPIITYATPQVIFDTTENPSKSASVMIVNGSFEQPTIEGSYASLEPNTVPGWDMCPIDPEEAINPDNHRIEIQKIGSNDNFAKHSVDGGSQYAEVNPEVLGYLFQDVNTVAGSRLYYTFYHQGIGPYSEEPDIMNFYIKNLGDTFSSTTGEGSNLIEECTAYYDAETDYNGWVKHTGQYIVPDGQEVTEFGFKTVFCNKGIHYGNLIDAFSVTSGAYVELNEKVSKVNANIGDTLTYTIDAKNSGEMDATDIKITSVLSDDVTYLGNVKINGINVSDGVNYDTTSRTLTIELGDDITTESIDVLERNNSGAGSSVSFDVKVNDISGMAGTRTIIKNQSKVEYRDKQQAGINDSNYDYSDCYYYSDPIETVVVKPTSTTSITATKIWAGDTDPNRPQSVEVQLTRDGIAYGDPVVLSDTNEWTYIWTDVIDEPTVNTNSRVIIATESNATKSNASEQELTDEDGSLLDGEVIDDRSIDNMQDSTSRHYTWNIIETTQLSSQYTSQVEKSLENNVFTVINTYTEPQVITPAPVPDSTGNGGTTGSSGTHTYNYDISLVKRCISNGVNADGTIDYEVVVSNSGDKEANGVFIVDFLPDHTSLLSAESWGDLYQFGKGETVTLFIPTLDAGESRILYLSVQIDEPIEEGEKIANVARYRVTGSKTPPTDVYGLIEEMSHDSGGSVAEITFKIEEGMREWLTQLGGNFAESNMIFDENGNFVGFKDNTQNMSMGLPKTGQEPMHINPLLITVIFLLFVYIFRIIKDNYLLARIGDRWTNFFQKKKE